MVFYNSLNYVFDISKTGLAKSNESIARYKDKHYWDVHLNVGNFIYISTANIPWHTSYLASLPHVRLDLSQLVALSSVLHFLFSCQLSLGVCTQCSILVISTHT